MSEPRSLSADSPVEPYEEVSQHREEISRRSAEHHRNDAAARNSGHEDDEIGPHSVAEADREVESPMEEKHEEHRAGGEVASPEEEHQSVDVLAEVDGTHDAPSDEADEAAAAETREEVDGHAAAAVAASSASAEEQTTEEDSRRKTRGQKRKSGASTRKVNLSNVQRAEPIPEGVNTPRSVALCAKYNINPRELARHRLEDFKGPGIPDDLADMRYRSYHSRLRHHLSILLPEYKTQLQAEEVMMREQREKELAEAEAEKQAALYAQRHAVEMAMRNQTADGSRVSAARQTAHNAWMEVSPNRASAPHRSPARHLSVNDERLANVQDRRQMLNEIEHMELVRRMLEKDKEAYQRLRELADEKEIYQELHHRQSDEPKFRQYTDLRSLAHVAAQYSRSRYSSPKRALDQAVLEEAMEHLSAGREHGRSSLRSREEAVK